MNNDRLSQATIAFGVLLAIGVASWAFSLVTQPHWGVFMANFVYFAGIAESALVLMVILRTANVSWIGPLYRIGGLVTMSFFPVALLMLLVILAAQGTIFYWFGAQGEEANPWLNPTFFVARQLIMFALFYGFAWSLFNHSMNAEDEKHWVVNRKLLFRGVPFMIIYVVHQSFIGWDMGMTLEHHFLSTVFTIKIWVGHLYGATAALILLMLLLRKFFDVKSISDEQFSNLGHLLLMFSVFWIYFTWADFFPLWYANLPEETGPMYARIFSPYGVYFFARVLMAAVPFVALTFNAVRASVPALGTLAVPILTGLWIERYLMVQPSLERMGKSAELAVLSPVNLLFTLGLFGAFMIGVLYMFGRYHNALAEPAAEAEAAH